MMGAAGPREAKSRCTQSVIPSRLASPTMLPLPFEWGSCTCQTHGRGCRARIGRPAASAPEILGRGSRGRNRRERSALVLCGVTNGNGCRHGHAFRKAFRGANYANRSCEMKKHLCLVCGALAGITILHFSAFAETAKPNATAAPLLPSPHH